MNQSNPVLSSKIRRIGKVPPTANQGPLRGGESRGEGAVQRLAFGVCALAVLCAVGARGAYSPIAVTGYNVDVVVETGASPFILGGHTTATMSMGASNTSITFYELGYDPNNPSSGLPAPDASFTVNLNGLDHTFRMAPSYTTNNAVFVQTNGGTVNIALSSPANYTALSFLAGAASGTVSNRCVVRYSDGGASTITNIAIFDWATNTSPSALQTSGAIDIGNRQPSNQTYSLFAVDIAVRSSSAITNLSFNWTTKGAPASHDAIFAISGQAIAGGAFSPVTLTSDSYNKDIVVEKTAPGPLPSGPFTTASMDQGVSGSANTWYERGFDPSRPATGLLHPGTTFTSTNDSNHQFTFAASFDGTGQYTSTNALFFAAGAATFNLVTPAAYSDLSLLTSAGAGVSTNSYTIHFMDGSPDETGTFISHDWFTTAGANAGRTNPVAFFASGRWNLSTSALDLQASTTTNPALYQVDIALANTASPISSIDFIQNSGAGHSFIFALSGVASSGGGSIPPFHITSEQLLSPTQFKLTWDSVVGHNYQVLSATSLPPVWVTNATVPAAGPSTSYTDTVSTARSFYRVIANP